MSLVIGGGQYNVGQSYVDEQDRQRQLAAQDRAFALQVAQFHRQNYNQDADRALAAQNRQSSLRAGSDGTAALDTAFVNQQHSDAIQAANRAQVLAFHQDDVKHQDQVLNHGIAENAQRAQDRAAALQQQAQLRGDTLKQNDTLTRLKQDELAQHHRAGEQAWRDKLMADDIARVQHPHALQIQMLQTKYAGQPGVEAAIQNEMVQMNAKVEAVKAQYAAPDVGSGLLAPDQGQMQQWEPSDATPTDAPVDAWQPGETGAPMETPAPPAQEWQPTPDTESEAPMIGARPGTAMGVIAAARAEKQAQDQAKRQEIERVHKANADAAAERLRIGQQTALRQKAKDDEDALPYKQLTDKIRATKDPAMQQHILEAEEWGAQSRLPVDTRTDDEVKAGAARTNNPVLNAELLSARREAEREAALPKNLDNQNYRARTEEQVWREWNKVDRHRQLNAVRARGELFKPQQVQSAPAVAQDDTGKDVTDPLLLEGIKRRQSNGAPQAAVRVAPSPKPGWHYEIQGNRQVPVRD